MDSKLLQLLTSIVIMAFKSSRRYSLAFWFNCHFLPKLHANNNKLWFKRHTDIKCASKIILVSPLNRFHSRLIGSIRRGSRSCRECENDDDGGKRDIKNMWMNWDDHHRQQLRLDRSWPYSGRLVRRTRWRPWPRWRLYLKRALTHFTLENMLFKNLHPF